jgi:hypothetical protein
LLLCLLALFFQDWKYRKIHILLPLVVFICAVHVSGRSVMTSDILKNAGFFTITLGALMIYMSIKARRFSNPFQNYFGLGDFLFYLAITPLFSLYNYTLFFIGSMLFAIAIHFVLRKKMQHSTIPLAGFSSLLLFAAIAKDLSFHSHKLTLL